MNFKSVTFYIVFVLAIIFSADTSAQLQKVTGKADYPFWLYLPADSIMKSKPPVVIFLHGRSLSGNDLNRVKKYGVIDAIERGRNIPAIVIAPQVRPGALWEPKRILSVLNYVQRNYKTDTSRVYVLGMSLGGSGTFSFAAAYPELIAGAVAIAGRANNNDPCKLAKVNLWVMHGEKDFDVPLFNSTKIVDAMKKCKGGGELKFTVYPEYNHSTITRVFQKDEIYEWLFKQRKKH